VASGLNLREQLRQILPDILPKNPAEAIKGTELIQLVKFQLQQPYSDATLRYHFSIMSCDPSSPIAKVEHGQGYYQRSTTLHSLESARNFIPVNQEGFLFGGEDRATGEQLALSRANRFRAVFNRFCEFNNRFPFAFEGALSHGAGEQFLWRLPDVATVEWLIGEVDEESGSLVLDQKSLQTRQMMGGAPFKVTALKLKLDTNYATARADFFRTLSSGLWANYSELVIAAELSDEQLVADLRELSDQFGVGVTSLGLTLDVIDDLPEPAAIENMRLREFEALLNLFTPRRIALPRDTGRLDWQSINQFRDNEDFETFYQWTAKCLEDGRAYTAEQFTESKGGDVKIEAA
tara:strand:+ start:50926 stop:51972 length:1047 start_codon:yes stop_codon:yes gene_type:complete